MQELDIDFGNPEGDILHEIDTKKDEEKKSFRDTINQKEIEPEEFEHLFTPDPEELDYSEEEEEDEEELF